MKKEYVIITIHEQGKQPQKLKVRNTFLDLKLEILRKKYTVKKDFQLYTMYTCSVAYETRS